MPRGHENYSETDLFQIEQALPRLFHEDQNVQLSDYNQIGIWMARELDYVKTKIYEKLYPAINANTLVPDATDVPEWAETVTIRAFSNVGMAKVISNYADDLPRADIIGAIKTVAVKTIGDSFGYNVNELRASRATGVGLDARKGEAARRAIELKLATIKLRGDAEYGLYGLFTHPNISTFTFPNPGPWTPMAGDLIYANLLALVAAYELATLDVHQANFLALAPLAYQAASTKFMTIGASGIVPTSALELFEQQFPQITVRRIWECAGAGPTGQDVALLYENNVDNLAHEFVMPFTQLPPEARNLEIITDCIARSAGVQVYYPLALLKAYTT